MEEVDSSLDATDRAIVDELVKNAKATLTHIGAEVGLSAPAVKRRIDRLEKSGVLLGYTAVVDHRRLGMEAEAFIELRFVGTAPVDAIESLAEEIPEVQAVFTIAGDPDALAWIRAASVSDLPRVIDAIRATGKVTGTKTLIVLASRSETTVTGATRTRA